MCCTASQTIKIISILQSGREVSSSEIVRRARDYLWSWPDINFHLYCPIPESFTAKKSCFIFFLEDWGYLAVTKYLSILKCRSLYWEHISRGCETCNKTCQLSERRKSIELLTQFCSQSKSPCPQNNQNFQWQWWCAWNIQNITKECKTALKSQLLTMLCGKISKVVNIACWKHYFYAVNRWCFL